jgi:adenylate cyclase
MPCLVGSTIAACVVAFVVLLKLGGALQVLDLLGYDLLIRFQHTASVDPGRISLVTVNEQDINAFGEWPLSDATLARAIDTLESMGAQVIGLDIYRDRPIPPGSEALERRLVENANVIVVNKMGGPDGIEVLPPAALAGSEQVGFSDVVLDSGGVVRRGLLFLDDGRTVSYSFALRLALAHLEQYGIYPQSDPERPGAIRLGEVTLPPLEPDDGPYVDVDAAGYQLLLDFRDGRSPYPSVTLSGLLNGDIDAKLFAGRVVIIGVSAASVKDLFYTPFSSFMGGGAGVPGIEVHASLVNQLLRAGLEAQQPMHFMNDGWESGWILLWGVLATGAGLSLRSFKLLAVVMAAGLAVQAAVSYHAFTSLWWVSFAQPALAWVLVGSVLSAYRSSYERSQRELLMQLFEKHVSSDVASEIWNKRDQFITDGRLRSQKLTATILFTDIEHFTSVSERLSPEELMDWLNTYMEAMANVVIEYGGVIDDYYGDAIKANFGVPLPRETADEIRQDAVHAVRCALAMRDRLAAFNVLCVERGLPRLRMRVGICTGSVVAGCLGSSRRMKYTTIGDTVNTAARLESFDKASFEVDGADALCRILVAESTFDRVRETLHAEPIGRLELKGKQEAVRVFRVTGGPDASAGSYVEEVRL